MTTVPLSFSAALTPCGILRSVIPPRIAICVAVVGFGCTSATGTSPTAGGAATSTVDNTVPTLMPMISVTAFAAKGLQGAGSGNQITVEMVNLAGVSDICALATSNQSPANTVVLLLVLGTPAQTVNPGQYPVGATLGAIYITNDASCRAATPVVATAGTVDLIGIGTSFAGSFDLTFPTGRMAGNFDAPLCSSPGSAAAVGDGGTACVQYPACAQGQDAGPCLP